MPQTKRKRGWKACDPFCRDKVRKALYNRPNGPHQGKLVMGKTYLSGIDGKCFSRTGRIKKGYRNVPIDLEREFEIEKREIKSIRDMIRGPTEKQKIKRAEKKKQQKLEYEMKKAKKIAMEQNTEKQNDNNDNTKTDNNLMENQIKKPIQNMDKLERMNHESFGEFIRRVNKTTSYYLNEGKHRQFQQKMKRRQRNYEKKLRREQRKIETKRIKKLEEKKKRKEQRQFEQRIKPKKEYIPFGATNDRPPIDLHKLGADLFGKRVQNKNNRNINNLNVGALTFANVIKGRAKQIKQQAVIRNYAKMKQKRIANIKMTQDKSKRKVW